MIKTIFINLAIFFTLLGMAMVAPPIVHSIYSVFKSSSAVDSDPRSSLPNYQAYPWAQKHFVEFFESRTSYQDFIVWRRDDYAGETVNVEQGLRRTVVPKGIQQQPHYKFFGGSTMWGQGVNDENTIPSVFSKMSGESALNYGDVSYIARQSLAMLSNIYIQESEDSVGDTVVFYDGVNEVLVRCRSEVSALGTDREGQIQQRASHTEKWTWGRTFAQLLDFVVSLSKRGNSNDPSLVDQSYNCDDSPDRALEVATTLVNTWQAARALAEENKDRFVAILQPVSFIGEPNLDHLDLSSQNDIELAKNYRAVYPLIKTLASQASINFIDMTSAYDNAELFYIDFCHVSPQAHQALVPKLLAEPTFAYSQTTANLAVE